MMAGWRDHCGHGKIVKHGDEWRRGVPNITSNCCQNSAGYKQERNDEIIMISILFGRRTMLKDNAWLKA